MNGGLQSLLNYMKSSRAVHCRVTCIRQSKQKLHQAWGTEVFDMQESILQPMMMTSSSSCLYCKTARRIEGHCKAKDPEAFLQDAESVLNVLPD
mmetsp:Transcript_8654/g.24884  ORF Transcript_8654/g.24884 Transcript_8654/m.24884 type:complete len:94 (-) Transcript_8654:232-513(-)